MEKLTSEVMTANYYGLITQERAEKFDLVEQLVLTQSHPIILCGVEGVGKSRLLETIKTAKENSWVICLVQGLESLSFEQIKIQLSLKIQQQHPEIKIQYLESLLKFCEQQQQKVVLMIDDTAKLSAGLACTLIEYAQHHPALGIIFAFTREQLYLKSLTDSRLDEGYFVEIPVITRAQIAFFLHDLSISASFDDEADEISDKLLSELYQRTGGVPGRIVAMLPMMLAGKEKKHFQVWKGLLLPGIILVGAGFFYLQHHHLFRPPFFSVSLPLKPAQQSIKPHITVMTKQERSDLPVSVPVAKLAEINTPLEKPITQQVMQPYDVDTQWVLQQAPEKYTLQLMAFSKRESLLNVVENHHNLQSELKIVKINNNQHEKFVLLYGLFADLNAANKAVNSLPAELKKALPRQCKTLQKDIKNQ